LWACVMQRRLGHNVWPKGLSAARFFVHADVPRPPAAMSAARARFFSKLPADELTPMEHALRKALLKSIDACSATPFPLIEWIDRRIGGEIETRRNESGSYEIFPRGSNPPPVEGPRKGSQVGETKEAFFSSLPGEAFAPPEEALRDAIFEFLASWRSPELATLQQMSDYPEVKRRQAAFLPKTVPLRDWIEHRIGAEIEFRPGGHGRSEVIHLTEIARETVIAKLAQIQARGMAPMGFGGPMPMGHPPPLGHLPPPPGYGAPPHAIPPGTKGEDFFAKLPGDELLPGEMELRAAVLAWIERWSQTRPITRPPGSPPQLSDTGADAEIRRARAAVLPKSVKLAEWIERRIGGEVELRSVANGQQEVYLRGTAPPEGRGRVAGAQEREAFFAALPEEAFSEAEETLRAALLDFLDRWSGVAPPALSDAAVDEAVAEAKGFLPKGVLKEWIDRRIGGEIETQLDGPKGQAIFGKRGELGSAAKRRRAN